MNLLYKQIPDAKSELEYLFKEYVNVCRYSKRLSEKTISGYTEVFSTFSKIMFEIKDKDDLHAQMMPEFFRRISTRIRIVGKDTRISGVKASTIRTYHNKLVIFFKWLENNGHLTVSITEHMIVPPVPMYEDERALTDSQVAKIISSITLYGMEDAFIYARDIAIVSLLLYTGVRKGELLALRIGDIDFGSSSLFINGVTSKSKKSRYIPLHFSVVTHLMGYLKEREKRNTKCEYLLVSSKADTALTEHGLKFWVNKYIGLSGVKFHLHRFRHTFACKLAKKNADIISIMNVMGHSTTRMTERYLRSIKAENSRSYIDKLTF
jgi:integrase